MIYFFNLLLVSIIICFYNEAWLILLRIIYSILNRIFESLVYEIFLVDDLSILEELKGEFENYVVKFFKFRLVRTFKREGFIRGRMIGA